MNLASYTVRLDGAHKALGVRDHGDDFMDDLRSHGRGLPGAERSEGDATPAGRKTTDMNGMNLRSVVLAALLMTGVLAPPAASIGAGTTYAQGARPTALLQALKTGALATFDVGGESFRVWTTNPETIQQLKALKAGTSSAHIPNGRIVRGPGKVGYNKPWSWHLDPQDIQMAEVTTEVCDGRPSYINQQLDEFVDNVKRYCPWSAQLVSLYVIAGAPTAPTNLRLTGVTRGTTSTQKTTVRLQWQDRSRHETGFRIRATFTRRYGGSDSQRWDVGPNVTRAKVSFLGGGINPVTRACFTVAAVKAAAESARSNQVCITM